MVAESERFALDEQLVINQIDVDKLRTERRKNTSFVQASANNDNPVTIISTDAVEPRDFTLLRNVNPHPFIPTSNDMFASCDEIFSIQVCGLAKRLVHTCSKRVVLGISGGLDSTLALLA